MIPLDSPLWAQLKHANGPATDMPGRLVAARANPIPKIKEKEEPWYSLWTSLIHDGAAFTASYAATPHLVDIASGAAGPFAWDLVALPTAIETARRLGQGPAVPATLQPGYDQAVAQIEQLAEECLVRGRDPAATGALEAGLALARGDLDRARKLLGIG